MKVDDVISKIIQIPYDFYNRGDVSFLTLLKESGYFEIYNQVSIELVREFLIHEPKRIHEWLRYSEDDRSNKGWYFYQIERMLRG
ncbi:MAG: hypothetical protein HZA48_11810 [Planctomycetes bacterium]|nr:hypothetical protein [Planctomycetota bacterium]